MARPYRNSSLVLCLFAVDLADREDARSLGSPTPQVSLALGKTLSDPLLAAVDGELPLNNCRRRGHHACTRGIGLPIPTNHCVLCWDRPDALQCYGNMPTSLQFQLFVRLKECLILKKRLLLKEKLVWREFDRGTGKTSAQLVALLSSLREKSSHLIL